MITKCPHCNTTQKAPDDATGREALCKSCRQLFEITPHPDSPQNPSDSPTASEPPDNTRITDQSTSGVPQPPDSSTVGPSRLAVMILIAIIAIAAGWTTGFFCGGILTKPNRQKVATEIAAIQNTAQLKINAARKTTVYVEGLLDAQIKSNTELREEATYHAIRMANLRMLLSEYAKPLAHGLELLAGHDIPRPLQVRNVRAVPDSIDGFYVTGEIQHDRNSTMAHLAFGLAVYHHDKTVLAVEDVFLSYVVPDTWRAFKCRVHEGSAYQVAFYTIHRGS